MARGGGPPGALRGRQLPVAHRPAGHREDVPCAQDRGAAPRAGRGGAPGVEDALLCAEPGARRADGRPLGAQVRPQRQRAKTQLARGRGDHPAGHGALGGPGVCLNPDVKFLLLGDFRSGWGWASPTRPRSLSRQARVDGEDPGNQPRAAGGRERGSQPSPAATGRQALSTGNGCCGNCSGAREPIAEPAEPISRSSGCKILSAAILVDMGPSFIFSTEPTLLNSYHVSARVFAPLLFSTLWRRRAAEGAQQGCSHAASEGNCETEGQGRQPTVFNGLLQNKNNIVI